MDRITGLRVLAFLLAFSSACAPNPLHGEAKAEIPWRGWDYLPPPIESESGVLRGEVGKLLGRRRNLPQPQRDQRDLKFRRVRETLEKFAAQTLLDNEKLQKKRLSLKIKGGSLIGYIRSIAEIAGVPLVIAGSKKSPRGYHNLVLERVSASSAVKALCSFSNRDLLPFVDECGVLNIVPADKIEGYEEEIRRAAFKLRVAKRYFLGSRLDEQKGREEIRKVFKTLARAGGEENSAAISINEMSGELSAVGSDRLLKKLENSGVLEETRKRQVRIGARIVVAEDGFERKIGTQLSGFYNKAPLSDNDWQFAGFGRPLSAIGVYGNPTATDLTDYMVNGVPSSDVPNVFSVPVIFGGGDLMKKRLNAILTAAEEQHEIKTLMNPDVLVIDGKTAEVIVGESVPIGREIEESVEGRLRRTYSIRYKDIGLRLMVSPRIAADGKKCFIEVELESSTPSGDTQIGESKYPIIRTTRSKTSIVMRSGETVVIAGMRRGEDLDSLLGLPLISDIPILNILLGGKRRKRSALQLMLFLSLEIFGEEERKNRKTYHPLLERIEKDFARGGRPRRNGDDAL